VSGLDLWVSDTPLKALALRFQLNTDQARFAMPDSTLFRLICVHLSICGFDPPQSLTCRI
jgi:hypothetical protein